MKDLKKRILAFFCLEYEVSCWFKLHDNQPITEIGKVMNEEELVSAYKFFQERELREANWYEKSDMDGYCFVDHRVRRCLEIIQKQLFEKKFAIV